MTDVTDTELRRALFENCKDNINIKCVLQTLKSSLTKLIQMGDFNETDIQNFEFCEILTTLSLCPGYIEQMLMYINS